MLAFFDPESTHMPDATRSLAALCHAGIIDVVNRPGRLIEGSLTAANLRLAIVASRFNAFLVEKLVSGALDGVRRHGGNAEHCTLAWVPGAFELPLAAKKLAESGKFDAVVCLGAVVRGDTPHFDYVAGECAKGISQVALQTGVPCIFGVVTTDNLEQAIERCGTKAGNKGYDAAVSAIEMANLLREMGGKE
jgi:6,7-dimethyl-8-ribityllumazine synthase